MRWKQHALNIVNTQQRVKRATLQLTSLECVVLKKKQILLFHNFVQKQKDDWIILFTGFEDRDLMLRDVLLDVSPVVDGVGVRLLSLYRSWRVQEGLLLKMPHTDSAETSRRAPLNIRPRSSNPVNKIIHNTGSESLNQEDDYLSKYNYQYNDPFICILF